MYVQARILEVLLTVDDRAERAAMLPDAFTPPPREGWEQDQAEDDAYFSPDEEQLHTTPLQMLRAVDHYSAQLEAGRLADAELGMLGAGGEGALPGREELLLVLQELRDDVLTYWEGGTSPLGDGEC